MAALVGARVFAGITATATLLETSATTGLRAESTAELAVVLLALPDGSRALPLFQDLQSLRRWRLDVRPVPMTGSQACAAALEQGAVAVVIDPGGAAFTLTDLEPLAQGWVPVPGSTLAARHADTPLQTPSTVPGQLVAALRIAVAAEGLLSARLLEGPDGLVLGVAPARQLGPAELADLAQRLVHRLGEDLPREGLGLTQVDRVGPGREILQPG